MKLVFGKFFFILAITLLVFSCSVQKRKYQKGFYVSNVKYKKHIEKKTINAPEKLTKTEALVLKTALLQIADNSTSELLASAETNLKPFLNYNFQKKTAFADSACDIITLKNGDEIAAKILEITPIEIKYKKCDLPDGPLYIVKKSDAFMIKYANGTKEILKSESVIVPKDQNATSNYKGPKKTHPFSIWALVFAILGIWPLTGLGSVLAIIFASLAIKRTQQFSDKYKGYKLAIIARNIAIGTLIGLLVLLMLFLFVLLGII